MKTYMLEQITRIYITGVESSVEAEQVAGDFFAEVIHDGSPIVTACDLPENAQLIVGEPETVALYLEGKTNG